MSAVVETLSTTEVTELQQLEADISAGLRKFIDVGRALIRIKEKKLYREYGTFADYCDQKWGFSINYAQKQMRSLATEEALRTSTIVPDVMPSNESQSRAMDTLSDEEKRTVWKESVDTAPGGTVTASHVHATRDRLFPKVTTGEPVQKGELIKCPLCSGEFFKEN